MYLEIILISMAIILSLYVFLQAKNKQKKARVQQEAVALLKSFGSVIEEAGRTLFETKRGIYKVLFYHIPLNAELTINSKIKWEIRLMGRSTLVDMSRFLSGPEAKLVIVFPITQPIKRYINENEMTFVKAEDRFHNMHVVRLFELRSMLEEHVL
ncbi:MAG: hypothetical protein EA375_03210 [Acholeplasmataceae bacterium]|nr:MAG: hypothetical protein EA375_03210 [Acholeplasmataceae bacterium]